MYGAMGVTVKPDGRPLGEAIEQAIQNLPKDIYLNPVYSDETQEEIKVDYNIKPLCYKTENGKLYMRIGDEMDNAEKPNQVCVGHSK